MREKIALSLAISSLLVFSNQAPAKAVDFQKIMKNYVDKNVLKKGSGGAQAATANNVNMHQARLEAAINEGVKSGKLSTTEETELRNMFNQLNEKERNFLTDGKYSNEEANAMVADIQALEAKINQYTGNTTNRSAAATPTKTAAPATPAAKPVSTPAATTTTSASGTASTSDAMYKRIANSLATGKITRNEANDLFKIEGRMHNLEKQLRGTTTGSFDKQRTMFREFEQLNASIDKKLTGR